MSNSELLDNLRSLGLSKTESKVYLAALELGPCSILELSKSCRVKRPTCYLAMSELIKQGIAKSVTVGKKTQFSVVTPRKLSLIEEGRHNSFVEILPQLEGIASKSPTKPSIRLYDGEVGIMEVYNKSLDLPKGSEILIYGMADSSHSYGKFIEQYIKIRVARGIKTRSLLPDTTEHIHASLKDFLNLQDTKFLPHGRFDQQTEVLIFGESIAYIVHHEAFPFAMVIENVRLASEEKNKFNLLWELGIKIDLGSGK